MLSPFVKAVEKRQCTLTFLSHLHLAEERHRRYFSAVFSIFVVGVDGKIFVEFLRLALFCDKVLTGARLQILRNSCGNSTLFRDANKKS